MSDNGNLPIDKVICGDVIEMLKTLPDESVNCIVTSPPYWGLRDYGHAGQVGLEPTLEEYIEKMLAVTGELKRVLRKDGTLWWNHGDCYYNHRPGQSWSPQSIAKGNDRGFSTGQSHRSNKMGIPQKCLALQNYRLVLRMIDEQGWILRNTVIWSKPNGMPSSVRDRFSNRYEPVFFFSKSEKYWFDLDAVRVPHSEATFKRIGQRNLDNQFQVSKTHSYRPDTNIHKTLKNMRDHLPEGGKNPGDVMTLPTQPFPEAHFATFPEKLISPFILAGCPEWVCTECGKPRVRVTELEYGDKPRYNEWLAQRENKGKYKGRQPQTTMGYGGELFAYYKDVWGVDAHDGLPRAETRGWTRCDCGAPFTGGIVLDPFGGSGTTGMVAKRLNRRHILIDLSSDYCKMARKRIGGVSEWLPFEAPDVAEAAVTKSEQAEIKL